MNGSRSAASGDRLRLPLIFIGIAVLLAACAPYRTVPGPSRSQEGGIWERLRVEITGSPSGFLEVRRASANSSWVELDSAYVAADSLLGFERRTRARRAIALSSIIRIQTTRADAGATVLGLFGLALIPVVVVGAGFAIWVLAS